MIHHVFEVFQQHKRDQTVIVVEEPYQMTSSLFRKSVPSSDRLVGHGYFKIEGAVKC